MAVATPTSFREVAAASIAVKDAAKGAPVKGTLSFGGAGAFFESSKTTAEVVSQNPKVKRMLDGLANDPLAAGKTGRTLVSVTGHHRMVDGQRQILVTDIKFVGPLMRLDTQGLTKKGNEYFGTFAGKQVQVKAMSTSTRELMGIAVAEKNSQVTGRLNKGVFEAWNIAVPMRGGPVMKPNFG